MAKKSEITNESNIVNIAGKSNLAGRNAAIMFHKPYMETAFYEKQHLETECAQLGVTIINAIYNEDKDAFVAYKKLLPYIQQENDNSKPLLLFANAKNLVLPENRMSKIILSVLIDLKEIELYLYNQGFNMKNGKSELALEPCTAKGILHIKQPDPSLGVFI